MTDRFPMAKNAYKVLKPIMTFLNWFANHVYVGSVAILSPPRVGSQRTCPKSLNSKLLFEQTLPTWCYKKRSKSSRLDSLVELKPISIGFIRSTTWSEISALLVTMWSPIQRTLKCSEICSDYVSWNFA